jgi:hypothetical protein
MSNWKDELKKDGYTHLRGIVPQEMVAAARADIDRLRRAQPEQPGSYAQLESAGCESIHNLLRKSPVADYVEEALGWDNVGWYQENGQIAIIPARSSFTYWQDRPHIDGLFDPGTRPVPFSMLVGVYLSTTPGPFSGNFVVYPGSHLTHEKYFREGGPEILKRGQPFLYYAHSAQLVVEAGDAVLCHYQLAHCSAANTSDTDRIAVYYRIALRRATERLANLWSGWRFVDKGAAQVESAK